MRVNRAGRPRQPPQPGGSSSSMPEPTSPAGGTTSRSSARPTGSFFDQLLPEKKDLDFGSGDELEVEPVSRDFDEGERLEVRGQTAIQLEEIPLVPRGFRGCGSSGPSGKGVRIRRREAGVRRAGTCSRAPRPAAPGKAPRPRHAGEHGNHTNSQGARGQPGGP